MNKKLQLNLLRFLHEAEGLKTLLRHSWLSTGRRESVAEHTWRLILMAVILRKYLKKKINLEKVVSILAVHDLAEIYAGDEWAWKRTKNKDKKQKVEAVGMKKLVRHLPPLLAKEIYALWEEYSRARSPEARFAKSLDKIEVKIQHNEGDVKHWNKKERSFNLIHGEEWCKFDPFIHEFWKLATDEAAYKLKSNKHF